MNHENQILQNQLSELNLTHPSLRFSSIEKKKDPESIFFDDLISDSSNALKSSHSLKSPSRRRKSFSRNSTIPSVSNVSKSISPNSESNHASNPPKRDESTSVKSFSPNSTQSDLLNSGELLIPKISPTNIGELQKNLASRRELIMNSSSSSIFPSSESEEPIRRFPTPKPVGYNRSNISPTQNRMNLSQNPTLDNSPTYCNIGDVLLNSPKNDSISDASSYFNQDSDSF